MNTTIQITFLSYGGRSQKKATFPLRKRKPEQVALDWIKEIKKELNVEEVLEVIAYGEDITEKVKKSPTQMRRA